MAITREQVWEVLDALVNAGKEPTYLLVRERLGTGSFGTIAKFLREWRARQHRDGHGQGGHHPSMPAPFQEAVLRLGAGAWRVALSGMQAEMAALRESNQRRLEELAGDCEQAARTADALQEQLEEQVQARQAERDQVGAERDGLIQERQALAERLLIADGTVAALREQVERSEAKAGALQQRNDELTRHLAQTERKRPRKHSGWTRPSRGLPRFKVRWRERSSSRKRCAKRANRHSANSRRLRGRWPRRGARHETGHACGPRHG